MVQLVVKELNYTLFMEYYQIGEIFVIKHHEKGILAFDDEAEANNKFEELEEDFYEKGS